MLYKGVVLRNKITKLALLIFGIISSTAIAGTVNLAWDASPDAGVVGYKVYYGGASGNYTNSALVGNVTNATFTGLVNGATYYFAASSIDGSGFEGDFSNETTTTVPFNANQAPTLNALANVAINEEIGRAHV